MHRRLERNRDRKERHSWKRRGIEKESVGEEKKERATREKKSRK